jgi:UDP-glucose 4-epimerase
MRYIVTGSCGFIGSNLVDMLISQGHQVIGIDNLSSDAHDQFYYNEKATYYKYSITDYVMCSDVFNWHRPDGVFHLAAEARIQNCIQDPGLCFETNVIGTETMLSLCKKHGVPRLGFMSTSAIYGLKANDLQKETDIPDCLNAYSLSKLHGEQICKLYSSMYGVDTVCFRGFNIYGKRMPKKGQYALVMGIFQRLLSEGKALTITGNGEQRRDFIHVDDVCRGLIAGMETTNAQNGSVYNLGTGRSLSINHVANLMKKKWKNELPIQYHPKRAGEAMQTCADVCSIRENLSWEPKVSIEEWIDSLDSTLP